MKITAAIARHVGGDFEIAELDLDKPREDEILVRIEGVGLCHTDMIAVEGRMPFALPAVLGHEGSGIVEQVGAAVRKVKVGDAVGLTFRSCGTCTRCKRGDPPIATPCRSLIMPACGPMVPKRCMKMAKHRQQFLRPIIACNACDCL